MSLRVNSYSDLSKYCRTCFSECGDEGYNIKELSTQLYRLFTQCIPCEAFKKNDINLICPLCYDTLRNFEEFRSKAVARTYFLEKFIKAKLAASVSEKENIRRNSIQNEIPTKKLAQPASMIADNIEEVLHVYIDSESDEKEVESQFEGLSEPSNSIEVDSQFEGFSEPSNNIEVDSQFEGFSEPSNSKNHMKKTNKKRKECAEKDSQDIRMFACSHCDHRFKYSMSLSNHLKEVHNLKNKFTVCPYRNCNRVFHHYETASQHYKIHHVLAVQRPDVSSICELCGETLENSEKRIYHQLHCHTPSTGESELSSEKTSKTPVHPRPLKVSKLKGKEVMIPERKIRPNRRLYSCSICDNGFYYANTLNKHLTKAHNLEPTATVCRYEGCNETFDHEEVATQHFRYNHQLDIPKESSCICELCGKIFETEKQLKCHRYQHEPDTRPFKCESCNKRFISASTFKEHMLRHAGIKAYECPHCDAKRTSARELRAHLHVHSKEKQYLCPLCPRTFQWPSALQLHDRIVHKGIRRFCRFCNQGFGKMENLRYHERRHTGEKPFECKICGKKFVSKYALQGHNKTKLHQQKAKASNTTEKEKSQDTKEEIDTDEEYI